MLNSTVLYFVPVVNVDGVRYISERFAHDGDLRMIRKNRNDGRKDGTNACRQGADD
jgi:murein tripeptide amidase MpaA